jgi:hypothetical protein
LFTDDKHMSKRWENIANTAFGFVLIIGIVNLFRRHDLRRLAELLVHFWGRSVPLSSESCQSI